MIKMIDDGDLHQLYVKYKGKALVGGTPVAEYTHTTWGGLTELRLMLTPKGTVDVVYIDGLEVYRYQSEFDKAIVDYDRAMGII